MILEDNFKVKRRFPLQTAGHLELPTHFLETTLPKLGGGVVLDEDGLLFGAYFPVWQDRRKGLFIRATHSFDLPSLEIIRQNNPWVEFVDFVSLDSEGAKSFEVIVKSSTDELRITMPSRDDAISAQSVHGIIWGTDATYPFDLFQQNGVAATRLVAKVGDLVVGFLLGFWGQSEGRFWLESQILGVLPEFRHRNIGKLLKLQQREDAKSESVNVIHWTVDPLLRINALLNFNGLGGIATKFQSNHYAFVNGLNQVKASRFTISWAVDDVILSKFKAEFGSVADKYLMIEHPVWKLPTKIDRTADLLVEIPEDWTRLQRSNLEEALAIREKTDVVFKAFIGAEEGLYVPGRLVDIGGRVYLICKPFSKLKHLLNELTYI